VSGVKEPLHREPFSRLIVWPARTCFDGIGNALTGFRCLVEHQAQDFALR